MLPAETERRNAGGINIIVRSMKPFLRWLQANGHIDKIVKLVKQKEPRIITRILTDDQIEKLLYHKAPSEAGRRVHMLAVTILDGGYRIAELLSLHSQEIDWDNGLIQVRGKGSRDRLVPMSTDLRKRLFIWMKSHGKDNAFPSIRGLERSAGYRIADRNLKSLGEALHIPNLCFHKLRHTMATHYVRAGGDVTKLQRILGHSSITTTMRYIHIQTEDLTKAHEQFSVFSRSR